jgi:hypothetical protein
VTTCEKCGTHYTIGDWPFCPHGRPSGTVVSDSIRGGQTIENLGPDPVRVYSETQRRQIMKERGLVDYVRHRPGSPLTSNWDTVTQKTLDDAAELVGRERRLIHREPSADVETLSITITERGSFSVEPEENPT